MVGDSLISRTLNVLSTGVTLAYINGLDTMALTEKQQEKLQVYENNPVRIIVGAKRVDKKRMG